MPLVFPHLYLIRPRPELAARAGQLEVVPWFAEPHIWSIPAVGNHDHPDQLRGVEEDLKWFFLADLAAGEGEPAERALAESLLAPPLRVETFDRHWELAPAGIFLREATADAVGASAMRAVASAAGAPGPSTWWLDQIPAAEEHARRQAIALVWALDQIRHRFGAALEGARCSLRARAHESSGLEAAARGAGWEVDRHAPLDLVVEAPGRDAFEFAFEIGRRRRGHREEPVRGTLRAEVNEHLEVTRGSMTLVSTTILTEEGPR